MPGGSPAIAAFVGLWVFWVLLIYGYAVGELSVKAVLIFLASWLVVRFALMFIPWAGAHGLFAPYVAVLDIALVFVIFEGDVPLN